MPRFILLLLIATLLLVSCASQSTPTSTPLPTTTSMPIPSTTPTLTATATQVARVITAQAVTVQAASASTVILSRLPIITPKGQPQTKSPDASGNLTVTLEDGEKIIVLKVGQRFLLNLGEGYDWTVDVADQTVASRVIGIAVVRGAQGVYEAHKVGRTTLDAVGDLPCRKSQPPCMAPSRLFHIEIIVQ